MADNRHLQIKRSSEIYSTKAEAKTAMQGQLENLLDGEFIIGTYNEGDGNVDLLGMAIKKGDTNDLYIMDLEEVQDNIVYNPGVSKDMKMTSAHGGIAKDTTAGSLSGHTFSKMFDDILFPTLTPYLKSGLTLSITPKATKVEVGTAAFTAADFTVSFGRGTVEFKDANGNTSATGGGAYAGNGTTGVTLAANAFTTAGTYTYTGTCSYAQGPTYKKTNGDATAKLFTGEANPCPASSITKTANVTAVYYYGTNMKNTITADNTDIKKQSAEFTTNITIDANVPELQEDNKVIANGGYQIALPPTITATSFTVMQYNAGSGKYDANDSANWEISGTVTLKDAGGNNYTCRILQHKAGTAANNGGGAAKVSFQFTF